MAKIKYNWLPGRRTAILQMAKTWMMEVPARGTGWGIPSADMTELGTLTGQSDSILGQALSGERSPVITAECSRIFGLLTAKMQYIKERYFLSPPLLEEDYAALLLRAKDRSSTPVARPDALPDIALSFPGPGLLVATHSGPLNGRSSTDPRADEKVSLGFGFIGEGSAGTFIKLSEVPTDGSELPNKIITRRKTHQFDLGLCRGMKIYISACYMNGKNEEGPWSPIIEATIP
jgi:hypothetical protein